jgi:hypothetical protein
MNGETITLRNKKTGEMVTLRRKSPESSPTETLSPQTAREQSVDKLISQRPDISQQAGQEIMGLGQNMAQHPFVAPLLPAKAELDSFGGLMQRGEAAVANPLLEMGRGNFGAIPKSVWQGITGQRMGEMGDVARQAGLPELVAIAFGLATTGMGMTKLGKLTGLSKANNFAKLESTYGKDISRNIIKATTGLSDTGVDYGQRTGWRAIKSKNYVGSKGVEVPYNIASQVTDNMKKIAIEEHENFEKAINGIEKGSVNAVELDQMVKGVLRDSGFLNLDLKPTLKTRGTVSGKIEKFLRNAEGQIKENAEIPIDVVNTIKKDIKKAIPSNYFSGKKISLTEEQKLAKDISYKLDDLIGSNASVSENEAYRNAKASYARFKDAEARVNQMFEKQVGQHYVPDPEKVVNIFNKTAGAEVADIEQIQELSNYMADMGYRNFAPELFDWNLAQRLTSGIGAVQGGQAKIFSMFRPATRQILKMPTTQMVGQGIEQGIERPTKYLAGQSKIPAYLRYATGRNEGE